MPKDLSKHFINTAYFPTISKNVYKLLIWTLKLIEIQNISKSNLIACNLRSFQRCTARLALQQMQCNFHKINWIKMKFYWNVLWQAHTTAQSNISPSMVECIQIIWFTKYLGHIFSGHPFFFLHLFYLNKHFKNTRKWTATKWDFKMPRLFVTLSFDILDLAWMRRPFILV